MTTRKDRDAQADRDLDTLLALGSPAQQQAYERTEPGTLEGPSNAFRAGWAACRQHDIKQGVLRIKLDDEHLARAVETQYELSRGTTGNSGLPPWQYLPLAYRETKVKQLREVLAGMAATD